MLNTFPFITLAFLTLTNQLARSQEKNILELYKGKHYSEERTSRLHSDSTFSIYFEVSYDVPESVDEEHSHLLYLTISSSSLNKGKIYNIPKDSSIIKAEYRLKSIWRIGKINSEVTGTVEIVSQSKKEIILRFNFIVKELRTNKTYRYDGVRQFVKRRSD